METVFTYNPTATELQEIGLAHFTRDQYEAFGVETHWFDLALLFRLRQDYENEERAWSHIPERRDEFLRGLDVLSIQ